MTLHKGKVSAWVFDGRKLSCKPRIDVAPKGGDAVMQQATELRVFERADGAHLILLAFDLAEPIVGYRAGGPSVSSG
jgi:hypothetical protein